MIGSVQISPNPGIELKGSYHLKYILKYLAVQYYYALSEGIPIECTVNSQVYGVMDAA